VAKGTQFDATVTRKNKVEKNFFDSSFTITDYGACSVIYPYLDFDNPNTKDLGNKHYNGSVYYNEVSKTALTAKRDDITLLGQLEQRLLTLMPFPP
jgi:hypothetical protein